jgi:hypothetical protein
MNINKIKKTTFSSIVLITLMSFSVHAAPILSLYTEIDLSRLPTKKNEWNALWDKAVEETVSLMAQPMAIPRSKITLTPQIKVKSIHNNSWIAFQLSWPDVDKSEAGRLGEFSDAVAIQFPAKSNDSLPPVFMGAKDNPVHIFHWRAQYQLDKEHGLRSMKDLYPNMNPDMYPLEFKDEGHLTGLTDEKREVFSHGRAAGNPQSYVKKGIDEIFAEGFGTSSVIQNVEAIAHGNWQRKKGWTVIISRPLMRESGSVLEIGKSSFVAFAVWQGGKQEVGSRKSITMSWVPLQILSK